MGRIELRVEDNKLVNYAVHGLERSSIGWQQDSSCFSVDNNESMKVDQILCASKLHGWLCNVLHCPR